MSAQASTKSTTLENKLALLSDKRLRDVEQFVQKLKAGSGTHEDLKVLEAMGHLLPQNESRIDAEEQVEGWWNAQRELIKEYDDNFKFYEQLTETIEEKCKTLLKSKTILHQKPSSRTKEVESVEDKARKQARKLRKQGSTIDPKQQLYRRLVDLVGIRILVYFPDDVYEVAKLINESDEFDVLDSVVSYSRSRSDHREKDRLDQLGSAADLNYLDGPWEEESLSIDDIKVRWKNSGYRAVYLHVKLREQAKTQAANKLEDVAKSDADMNVRAPPAQVLRKGSEAVSSPHENDPWTDLSFPEDSVAEIQITTVVMHAWSQVEHDVIYKNPHRININNTMARMLDAVNGLSINSEIMLAELRQTLNVAEIEAKKRDEEKFKPESFRKYMQEVYIKDRDDRQAHGQWLSILSIVASEPYIDTPGYEIGTPAQLQNFVKEHKILKNDPKNLKRLDITILILKELHVQFWNKHLASPYQDTNPYFLHVDSKEDQELHLCVYKWLITVNAFSIMVSIGGQDAIHTFQNRFRNGTENLRLINAILLGMKIPVNSHTQHNILQFADHFLETGWSESHEIAVTLANLWVFMDVPGAAGVWAEGLSYCNMQARYGETQSIIFPPFYSRRVGVGVAIQNKNGPRRDHARSDERVYLILNHIFYIHYAGDLMDKPKPGAVQHYIFQQASDGSQLGKTVQLRQFGSSELRHVLWWMKDSWNMSCINSTSSG